MGRMSNQKKKRQRVRRMNRQNKFTIISITFVVCMLFGILLYNGHKLEQRITENDARIDELNSQIDDEKERTEDIYDLKEEMQSEEYIADVAQSKLGLVRENEIIFKPEK